MLDLDLNVNLKIEKLNSILTEYFDKEGFIVLSIDPKLKKQTCGSQMHEYDEITFDGIDITLKKKEPKIISSRDNWT